MLSKLSRRLSYANVMSTIAVVVAVGTGSAYAANTIGSSDIIDGEVKSVDVGDAEIKSADVKDQSLTTFDVSTFLGADIVDGTITGDDVADTSSLGASDIHEETLLFNNTLNENDLGTDSVRSDELGTGSVHSDEVADGSLTAKDVAENSFNFSANIPAVPALSCIYVNVGGTSAENDHMVLTPDSTTSNVKLTYEIEYFNQFGLATIHVCNQTATATAGNETTTFNLLVFQH
jgi:hypothetical protein